MNTEDYFGFVTEPGFNRDQLIDEAIDIIMFGDLTQGAVSEKDRDKEIDLLKKLKQEKISLPDRFNNVHKFGMDELKQSDIHPDELNRYDIYEMEIPIGLWSKSGWAFTGMECLIEFCPDEQELEKKPVIHSIFPSDELKNVMNMEMKMSVGIDKNLKYQVAEAGMGAKFIAGPFQYHSFRYHIKSRVLNTECRWSFEGQEKTEVENLKLRVILKVPKKRKKPVYAKGLAEARHTFQVSSADVFTEFLPDFGKSLQSFFKRGLPVRADKKWDNVLL